MFCIFSVPFSRRECIYRFLLDVRNASCFCFFFYEYFYFADIFGASGNVPGQTYHPICWEFFKRAGGLGRFVKTRKKCLTPGDEGGLVDESCLESDGCRVCQFVSWPS